MKVSDLRRKLIASLVAGGLLAPSAIQAANLDTNLVVNGNFETVDLAMLGGSYNGPKILNWTGTAAFAYAHTGAGGTGADYANGRPLAGGGQYYFSADHAESNITAAGQFTQDVDVSGGASGAAIAAGTAGFKLSAFFSGYLAQPDKGTIHVNFLNGGGSSLGTGQITNTDSSTWNQFSGSGIIPSGTTTARVSIFGAPGFSGGPSAYIDNVDFQVTNIQPALAISVNRLTGAITLNNQTGSAKNLASYSVTSAFEALAPANWLSIADNYDSGSPGPNQVDPAHAWTELTVPTSHGDLSEADLASGDGASLASGRSIPLGNAGTWIRTNREDLVFKYVSGNTVVDGLVNYVGGAPTANGDLNFDGSITPADWVIVRTNQKANLSGLSLAEAYRQGDLTGDRRNDHADFAAFQQLFDAANGVGAFTTMLNSVPEASGTILVFTAVTLLAPLRRRTRG